MKNKRMYDLSGDQLELHKKLKKIFDQKRESIISQIVEFIKQQHISKTGEIIPAVVGLSGGVDSSVTAWLLVQALGAENVIGVMMPYNGMSSRGSISDAEMLAEKLGITKLKLRPINKAVDALVDIAEAATGKKVTSLRKGNMMARARMVILYDEAAQCGGRVIDTCNLTEIKVGFFTKYGDGASDYNPVGYLYKTWIWQLAKYAGLPQNIINKAPSAELEPEQTDEGDMGITYRALDVILWLLYEEKISHEAIVSYFKFQKEAVDLVIKKYEESKHKRNPAPVCWLVC